MGMDKEALYQNADMQVPDNESRWDHIGIFDMFDDGEHLWFTSMEYNALFKMSKRTFQVDYIGSFPDEEAYGYRTYTSINECDGKLFFTPGTAHEIGVYNMKNKCFEKISIGISRSENDLSKVKYSKKFVSGFIYNNALILIPCCYDSIVVYDIITEKVSFQKGLFEHFYAKYNDCTTSLDSQFYLCWLAKRLNESEIVFNLHCNRNILVFYNLETGEFRERAVGNEGGTFSLIECNDRFVYLYDPCVDMLVRWEIETDRYSECHIADQVSGFQPCGLEHSFLNMAVLGDWLYLVPASTNVAVKVNTTTLETVAVEELSSECSIRHKGMAYLNLCKVFYNKLYLSGNRSKELIAYGIDGILQRIRIEVPDDMENAIAEKYFVDLICNHHCWVNEEQVPLPRFIDALICLEKKKHERCAGDEETASGSCGRSIYQHMKQDVLS